MSATSPYLDQANLPNTFTPDNLRHSTANYHMAMGMTPRVIMEIMGRSSPAVLNSSSDFRLSGMLRRRMILDSNLAPSERVALEEALAYLQCQQNAFSLAVEKYQQALVTEPAGDPAGHLAPLWSQVDLAQKALERAQRGLVNLRKSLNCCLHCGYRMTTDPGPCKQPGHRMAWERAGRGGAVPSRRCAVRRRGLVPWAGLAALLGGAFWIVLRPLVELSR